MADIQTAAHDAPADKIALEAEPIRVDMDKRVDVIIALAFAAFGVGAVFLATGFRVGGFPDPITARGLPYATGTYLVIAGLFLVARRILTWSQIPGNYTVAEGPSDERAESVSTRRPFAIMALILLWVLTVRDLGFLVITPVMLFGMIWLMGVREIARLILFPILFTLCSWLMFALVLGIRLPLGFLEPTARALGIIL